MKILNRANLKKALESYGSLTTEGEVNRTRMLEIDQYRQDVLRWVEGDRSEDLYGRLVKPPIFVDRASTDILAQIMTQHENGNPISCSYFNTTDANIIVPFCNLLILDVVSVEEKPFLYFWKRKVIVPKEKDSKPQTS